MVKLLAFISKLPSRINGRIQWQIIPLLLTWKITLFFRWRRSGKTHELKSPLIVSLTSYPARFNKLPLTLKCLLSQSIKADRVILWIAHQDKQALTPSILNLQKEGLDIAYCDDLRSYKKIIPTLQNYPSSFIVTADDDLYYWPTWLEELVQGYRKGGNDVVCHRAHRIHLGQDALPLPYEQWDYEIKSPDASPLNLQTGNGGVLYPPDIFYNGVLKIEAFSKLCSYADDVWLYWMVRLNGANVRCVAHSHPLYFWADTQQTALFHHNVADGGNNEQIKAMVEAYGFPSVLVDLGQ